jgi:hypothetical protein
MYRSQDQARLFRHRALRCPGARPARQPLSCTLHADARRGIEFPQSRRYRRGRVPRSMHASRRRGEEGVDDGSAGLGGPRHTKQS